MFLSSWVGVVNGLFCGSQGTVFVWGLGLVFRTTRTDVGAFGHLGHEFKSKRV